MTVAELIGVLQELNPNALVVQSKDGEGNGYSPTSSYGVGLYAADLTWSGEFWTPEPEDDDEPIVPEPGVDVHAVCLWPTN